jgi:hypothetical protein
VLARDGVVRSQFETRTSNGGLTAFPGGSRWAWESRIFGRAYDDAEVSRRPKYGALDFRKRRVGGSPRFGSAHFRLAGATLTRATFCYPDSFFEPTAFGTASRMALVEHADAQTPDALDDYIEAHVHGPIVLSRDVERHPAYRGAEFVALGSSLAEDGVLTPRHIGEAARAGKHDPQALKRVWHYVARFG